MPTPPDTPGPEPTELDGPAADRLLRAARGEGDDELMARVGRALRDLTPADHDREPPPADLWERIDAARRVPGAGGPTAGGGHPTVSEPTPLAEVVPLRRRLLPFGAVAAAVALVAGLAFVLSSGDDGDGVIATARLDPLQGSGTAVAELREAGSGLQLELQLTDVGDPEDRYLEVWLLRSDVSGLVSLGPVTSGGVYELPPGLDPGEFPVVDVSFEPLDGDPTHSGDSVLRGAFDFTA
jgi:anti-sigma-K factor RskA